MNEEVREIDVFVSEILSLYPLQFHSYHRHSGVSSPCGISSLSLFFISWTMDRREGRAPHFLFAFTLVKDGNVNKAKE